MVAVVALVVAMVVAMVGGTAHPVPAATSQLVLKLKPTSVTVARGSSVTVTLGLTRRSSTVGAVTVTGSSSRVGLTLAVADNPVAGSTTTIVVSAAANARTGRATLNVKGVSGKTSALVKLNVTITAPSAGTTLAGTAQVPGATPPTLAIPLGQTATVTFQTSGARAGVPISFGASGLPTGLKVVITAKGSSAQFVFTAATTTKPGAYTVTLRASQSGTVFFTSALPVTVSTATGAAATTLSPAAVTTLTASSTSVPAGPTVAGTPSTTPLTTTSTSTTTSTTTSTSASSTTVAVVVGADLVVARKAANDSSGLACSALDAALGDTVTVTFLNTATSARVMSQQTGCGGSSLTEGPALMTIAAGSSAVVTTKINTKFVFRSANDGGLRRAIQVTRSGLIDVGGIMTVTITCSGAKPYSNSVKLAQGQRVVVADIAPGSVCALNDPDGLQIYWKSWDNSGANADGSIQTVQRPAGCAPATPALPSQLNASNPCWVEIVFTW